MVHAREAERVLEDMIGAGEHRGIAGGEVELVADVLARPQLAGGTATVTRSHCQRRYGKEIRCISCQRTLDRRERGQVLVVDLDQSEGCGGLGLRIGGDGADDIAHVAHSIDGDDWLVFDEVAINRHEVRGNAGMREHSAHAGCALGSSDIEALDQSVRTG